MLHQRSDTKAQRAGQALCMVHHASPAASTVSRLANHGPGARVYLLTGMARRRRRRRGSDRRGQQQL